MIELESKVAGMFKIEAVKADGSRRVLADWFPNLITNYGLNYIGSSTDWLNCCQVGSGSTPPNVADTALASRIAGTSTINSTVDGNQSSAPYFVWRRNTYRFAEGVATGNISEVGVGPSINGNLLSRALILDSGGTPTTISVQSDESLDVTYEFRYYPPATDNTFTLNISGVDYSVTTRAASVTSSSDWTLNFMWRGSLLGSARAYNGAIGSITGSPSGAGSAASSKVDASYSANSHQREGTVTWALNSGNLSGGIGAITVQHGIGLYQLGFTPKIPKNSTKIFSITVRHSWARK